MVHAPRIGVTGATGRVGGRVASRLADRGVAQRLIVRRPDRAPALPDAAVAQAEYGDADAARAALDGIAIALMVSGAEAADRVDQHRVFVDAAVDAGVGHLVYLSFYGAGPDATFTLARDHWATEEHIRASGLAFTFLRDNLYADFAPALAGEDGVIRGPAGDGRAAVVAIDDIADAAVAVLSAPARHVSRTYSLTGPAALGLGDIAHVLAAVTGTPVTYVDESLEEAYRSRARYGAPDWQVDAWVSTYLAIANGELADVTNDVADLTGRRATPLADVLHHASRADPGHRD